MTVIEILLWVASFVGTLYLVRRIERCEQELRQIFAANALAQDRRAPAAFEAAYRAQG